MCMILGSNYQLLMLSTEADTPAMAVRNMISTFKRIMKEDS